MKKLMKYISVAFLFLLFFNSCCLATDIDMNLQSNSEANTQENQTVANNEIVENNNSTTKPTNTQSTPNYTNVSTTTSTEEDPFSIGNIINIFLVVVGIVLILLGLAILIRLKY